MGLVNNKVFAVFLAFVVFSFNFAFSLPLVGEMAPKLNLQKINGGSLDIADYKGSPVILTFFASWSKSCANQSEFLSKIYDEYSHKGLKVVAVSLDKKTDALKAFSKNNEIKYDILLDKKLKYVNSYAILVIPTTFFIGRDGEIKDIFVDFDSNIEKKLYKLVKNSLDQ